jgi:hypothetical protein
MGGASSREARQLDQAILVSICMSRMMTRVDQMWSGYSDISRHWARRWVCDGLEQILPSEILRRNIHRARWEPYPFWYMRICFEAKSICKHLEEMCLPLPTMVDHECPICLDDDTGGVWVQLPCGHCFHASCIASWLHSECPMCRRWAGSNKT